jgi:hypothetical protein
LNDPSSLQQVGRFAGRIVTSAFVLAEQGAITLLHSGEVVRLSGQQAGGWNPALVNGSPHSSIDELRMLAAFYRPE